MVRQRRVSDPPQSTSTYPASPAVRGSRSSSIFPYSLARPPTNYSEQLWIEPDRLVDAPPQIKQSKYRGSIPPRASPMSVREEEEEELESETPLYARSDWDDPHSAGNTDASAYSRSSFAATTALPTTPFRANTLGDIREEDEGGEGWGFGGGETMMMSPGAITATPTTAEYIPTEAQQAGRWATDALTTSPGAKTSSLYTGRARDAGARWMNDGLTTSMDAIMATPEAARYGNDFLTTSPGALTPQTHQSGPESMRRSTLPSVLELEHLTGKRDPMADPQMSHRTGYGHETPVHTVHSRPPGGTHATGSVRSSISGRSPRLLSPGAHQKLGRMSVATARYPSKRADRLGVTSRLSEKGGTFAEMPLKGVTGFKRFYQTWRPFIVAASSLVSALLLTISLQNNPGPVSRYVIVQSGGFDKTPPNIGGVGFGVNGWCPLDGQDCEGYADGDFANADATYTLPGDPLLDVLGDLLTALCAFNWLSALYLLTTGFLHFFLFFALSLPFPYLLDEAVLLAPNGGPSKGVIQAEVDIRVRTERPPYEAYYWVWWGWWGHRRAPVGHVYGTLTAVLALSSFTVGFLFKRSVASGTGGAGVSLGAGAYIPVISFLSALDPLVSALQWCWNMGDNWSTLLNPPDPSPAAIMLSPETKPMALIRRESGESFFAPRTAAADTRTVHTVLTAPPDRAVAELDEETRRWLAAYPADGALVSLIADLRSGRINDDFLLSDEGLLYVRPSGPDEVALLVPPRGVIDEILEDAHHEPDEAGNSTHMLREGILEVLSETFWWMTMEEDVGRYVGGCAGCAYDRGGVAGVEGYKPGMTPVPFTGVTGWTAGVSEKGGPGDSAMAAEMAFAMRKAEEDAERDRLG